MRFGLSRNHNLFEGEIEGTSFKISRIIHYRNSFLPILVGQIQDDLDASTLQIVARPHWFVILLWTFLPLPLLPVACWRGSLRSLGDSARVSFLLCRAHRRFSL